MLEVEDIVREAKIGSDYLWWLICQRMRINEFQLEDSNGVITTSSPKNWEGKFFGVALKSIVEWGVAQFDESKTSRFF